MDAFADPIRAGEEGRQGCSARTPARRVATHGDALDRGGTLVSTRLSTRRARVRALQLDANAQEQACYKRDWHLESPPLLLSLGAGSWNQPQISLSLASLSWARISFSI